MRIGSWITVPLSVAVLAGCAVGPNFSRPDSPAPNDQKYDRDEVAKTTAADGVAQRFDRDTDLPARWWSLFESPKLDPIVAQAFEKNQTLQAALASLKQSQFILQAGYGVFYPQIDASASAERMKSSPQSFGAAAPSTYFNLLTYSGTVSYVLDVFGGERRTVEGLRAQVEAQHYSLLAAYLTLTGNLVNAVVAQSAYEAEIQATHALIQAQREQVTLTQAQVKAGTQNDAALLSLQSQLSTLEATLPPLEQKRDQTTHLIANLSGQLPAQWNGQKIPLEELALPKNLPETLPSLLVRRRPDILVSESQLHASSANVGVATAALFPSFNLSANYGGTDISGPNILSGTNSLWSLAAGVTAPIFHGGTLLAQKKAAEESFQASLANYRQTVLNAFTQVADSLRALEHDADLLRAETQARDQAKEARDLIQTNFFAGTANYLQVLVANIQYDQAKIAYLQAVAQRLQDTVGLFVALGGGWWKEEVSNTR